MGTEITQLKKCGSAINRTWVSRLAVGCLHHSASEPTTLATWQIIDLILDRSEETFNTCFCNKDCLTTPLSIGNAPSPPNQINHW